MGSPLGEYAVFVLGASVAPGVPALFAASPSWLPAGVFTLLGIVAAAVVACELAGLRYIANNRVGIVEKLWSLKGSVPEGGIIALEGEAGFQAEVLRGGVHFGLWRWQYRIHKTPLVAISQGKIGYVYARDGEALRPSQTLGHVIDCNNFQDAHRFLSGAETSPEQDPAPGQRGRQRAFLREGVYAINLALFTVMTEESVYRLEAVGSKELKALVNWQNELNEIDGFDPVIIGGQVEAPDPLNPDKNLIVDSIGIVTVHDGPSLPPGEIIAPGVGVDRNDKDFHNNFQDTEAFLRAGGRRGKQYVPLTDGTYFINRWFATIETIPKTIVPIGYVGVIVSYYGRSGHDLSGEAFRHGERVAEGERGVQEKPLGPGKYAFNTYAGNIVLVPTTNFVLHWVTGRTEAHRYDESLRSIDLVTKDAYEPALPLSVVVHIDYQKAPSVIQRFGDVKKLITQTLDPLLSAYFRDIAHKRTMLELLQDRDSIQGEASAELGRKFHNFDIECVNVLIGKPDTQQAGGKIETLLEQLRLRQLSLEQVETYSKQVIAAQNLRVLNEAQAQAQMQTELSNSLVQVRIAENEAEAQLARARKQAEQVVVTAQAQSQERILAGRGEGRSYSARRSFRGLGPASEDQLLLRPAALRPVGRRTKSGEMHPAPRPRTGIHRGWRGRRDQWRRAIGLRRKRRQRTSRHAREPLGRGKIGIPARRTTGGIGPEGIHRAGYAPGDGRSSTNCGEQSVVRRILGQIERCGTAIGDRESRRRTRACRDARRQ